MTSEDAFKQWKQIQMSPSQEERILQRIRNAEINAPEMKRKRLPLSIGLSTGFACIVGVGLFVIMVGVVARNHSKAPNLTTAITKPKHQYSVPSGMKVIKEITSQNGSVRVLSLAPQDATVTPAYGQEVSVLRKDSSGSWYLLQTFSDQTVDIQGVFLNDTSNREYVTISRVVAITSQIGGMNVQTYRYNVHVSKLGTQIFNDTMIGGYLQAMSTNSFILSSSALGLNSPIQITFEPNDVVNTKQIKVNYPSTSASVNIKVLRLNTSETSQGNHHVVTITGLPSALSLQVGQTIAFEENGAKVPLIVLVAPMSGDPGGLTQILASTYDNCLMLKLNKPLTGAQVIIGPYPPFEGQSWTLAGNTPFIKVPLKVN